MGTDFSNMMSAFWSTIMEKLGTNKNKKEVVDDVIKDICQYFNFGCSFVYNCNKAGEANIFSNYHAYLNYEHITNRFNIKEKLGDRLFVELLNTKSIIFDRVTKKSEIDEAFMELFHAQSMILVPFKDKEGKLIAIIGMADRRGESREGDQDLNFAYYLLMVLGNYYRILLTQVRTEKSMRQLYNILDSTGLEVCVIDYSTDEILYANSVMEEKYTSDETIIGLDSSTVLPGGVVNHLVEGKDESEKEIFNAQMPDGSYRKFISVVFTWIDGRQAKVISSVDITQTVKNEEEIMYHAQYDELTGLRKRHKLLLDCDDAIDKLKSNAGEGYLIFGDLNKFKEINDTYGHNVGDEILICIGKYFNEEEKTRERTYRYAGDEFVILCLDKTKEEVDEIIEMIENRFRYSWEVSAGSLQCTISMGITKYPTEANTTSDLLYQADLKRYGRKNKTIV
ncbi:MAG: GGDEF domain-containing protein [Suipraeoptans sp.]